MIRKILISFIILTISCSAFSQTNKIKELEKKRKLALREIENTTLLLNKTKKSTTTLLNRINLLSEQIRSRQQVILLLNQEIKAIDDEQVKIEKEIASLEANLKVEQKGYAKAVEGIVHKKQNKNKLLYVLSGKSLSEALRRMKYLKDYSEWRNQQAVNIKDKQQTLSEKKQILEKSKANKLALLNSRQKEQLNLQQEEQSHQEEVTEATKKQKELQALLQTKQKQADSLNAQIEKLIAEEVARQEREAKRLAAEQERRRLEEEKRNNTSKTKENKEEDLVVKTPENSGESSAFVTKENFKLSTNFASNKGKLPMPVTGRYTITGRFGVHQHNKWKVTTNNNGIDIQAQAGAEARAVFSGEVSRIVAFPGFNNCIIVRHGGYYTFYGNIQQVNVKQGQKISTGQSLGVVYTDSDTGNSQLHFQLWKGTTKLNPEPWLGR